jgi:hypothetical protein
VAGAEGIMRGFAPFRESGQSAELTLAMKVVTPTGNDLMGIGLVADIPDEAVIGGVKAVVERQSQFDCAEIGSEMSASLRERLKEKTSQICCQSLKLFYGEFLEISWAVYFVK